MYNIKRNSVSKVSTFSFPKITGCGIGKTTEGMRWLFFKNANVSGSRYVGWEIKFYFTAINQNIF